MLQSESENQTLSRSYLIVQPQISILDKNESQTFKVNFNEIMKFLICVT